MDHIAATLFETFTLESNKFNLYKDEMVISIKTFSPFIKNFDVPYERCAYMYRYSVCHFYFLKQCMYDFFSGYEDSKTLIEGWSCRPNPNLCSLGYGPGLDFLAFISAIMELEPKPSIMIPSFLTQHGAWRNTVNLLSDAILRARESNKINKNINFNGLNVLQVNIFSNFKEDAVEILKNSDIVLMFKLLNLNAPDGNIQETLYEIASNIKPGAIVFFIDTMPSCCMMKEVLSEFNGTYLYGPVRASYMFPQEFSEELLEVWGKNPVKSARGVFFVWKKCIPISELRQEGHSSKLKISDHVSSLTQNIASINVKSMKDYSSSLSGTSNLTEIPPSAPEDKGFNTKSLESKSVEETSKTSRTMSVKKTIDYQEPNISTCSAKSSLEYKETSLEYSNEKDIKLIDKSLQIHQPLKESKYAQTDFVTDMLSDHQLSIIKSLTNKINNLASSVDSNFELKNQMNRNKDSVAAMVSEKLNTIEYLTERINRLITSLELVQSNQIGNIKCEERLSDD